MTDSIVIPPGNSALLLMDYQQFVVEGFGTTGDQLVNRTAELLQAARKAGILVVYVKVGFREGYPEISPRNMTFGRIKSTGRLTTGDPGAEIHSQLAPMAGELIVTKHRVSGFFGTELDMLLRAHDINLLILAGLTTQGVVLSTQRFASDNDYSVVIAHDCCGDGDAEAHRILVEKIFPRQAVVASAEEIISSLG